MEVLETKEKENYWKRYKLDCKISGISNIYYSENINYA